MKPLSELPHLFFNLMEELNEVALEASKCMRFTPNHFSEVKGNTNWGSLNYEYNDLLAVFELLEERHGLKLEVDRTLIEAKKVKMAKLMNVARELGALEQ